MVDIESELMSNGMGLMYFETADGKWKSGFSTPNVVDALMFVLEISLDSEYSMQPAPGLDLNNDTRRQTFYDGKAAFGCLYGAHYGADGANARCNFDYGIVPIPKGPMADKYSYVIPDLKVFILQNTNKDWVTSCKIMQLLGEKLTDKAEAESYLKALFRDEDSYKVMTEYCFPGAYVQQTRFSPDIKAALDAAEQLIMTLGPAGAVETVNNNIQAAIDTLFGYTN